MKLHWINKMIKDKKENDKLLYCYKIKNNLSKCLKENKGEIKNCNQLNLDFEDCLKFIDKKLKEQLDSKNTN